MIVYILEIISVLLLSFYYDKARNVRNKRIVLIIITAIMTTIMGFRYGVGQDYFFTYVPVYNMLYSGINANVSIGFTLLNKLCILLFEDNYQSIFVLCAVIMITATVVSCKDNGKPLYLMMFIYLCGGLYFYSFNVMRQCMPMSLFFASLVLVEKKQENVMHIQSYGIDYHISKNTINYFILMGIAASIHSSALVYLPVFFIIDKDIQKRTYIIIAIVFFFSVSLIYRGIDFVLEGTKYYNYISGAYRDTTKLINVSQILNALIFLVYLYTNPEPGDRRFIIYRNIHFIGLLFTLLMGTVPLVYRVSAMFHMVQYLSVPYYWMHYVKNKHNKIIYSLGIQCIYGALLVNTFVTNGNRILPYRWFLFK